MARKPSKGLENIDNPEQAGHASPPLEQRAVMDTVVSELRDLILSSEEERFLGSEEELAKHLRISRATLRVGAQKLISEQLLRVKRGVGGGYFSQRPSVDTIVHMASIYLFREQLNAASLSEMSGMLLEKAASLSARNPDAAVRAEPEAIFNAGVREPDEENLLELNKLLLDLFLSFGKASGNPVLNMFINIIVKIFIADHSEKILTVDRMRVYLEIHRAVVAHIRSGDVELATVMARRINRSTNFWHNIPTDEISQPQIF